MNPERIYAGDTAHSDGYIVDLMIGSLLRRQLSRHLLFNALNDGCRRYYGPELPFVADLSKPQFPVSSHVS